MEYTIGILAKLSGLTARTLRYYDEINLLKPSEIRSNGYRVYTEREVDRLQQIMFFRVFDMSPEVIKEILDSSDYDAIRALETHIKLLTEKKERLSEIIVNAEMTIAKMKGELMMTDKEKFGAFKKKLLAENEEKYGKELMAKYGETRMKAANEKFSGLTQEQYEEAERLSLEFFDTLKAAALSGDPASESAREACRIHRQWLSYFWVEKAFTPQSHLNLAEMYCSDTRFQDNMKALAEGRAEFFKKALNLYYDL
ncbi:MAG: MerR family transcriptional regulator [Clostridia bacterium]|nr:MerR family transcriptional regulator [Clostridia bacterium]